VISSRICIHIEFHIMILWLKIVWLFHNHNFKKKNLNKNLINKVKHYLFQQIKNKKKKKKKSKLRKNQEAFQQIHQNT